ncbi:hypothetical protein DFJ74DRAFT_639245 [Hyaloraphidium curvatum]|nr:hypothetical protein DFJ74DRAFT_639245 [Hyaloraphidium curvatum]
MSISSSVSFDFSGRSAVVIGGSLGIGKEVGRRLLLAGASVLLVGRRKDALEDALRDLTAAASSGLGGRCFVLAADVGTESGCEDIATAARQQFGHSGPDYLVNSAGIFDDADLLTLPKAMWDHVVAVNLTGPFLLTQKLGTGMAGRGSGCIINLASIDGHGVDGSYIAYNVTKAALIQLSKQTAVELGPFGVRCVSVSPGWTRTPMVESALPEHQIKHMEGGRWDRVPLRRMVSVDEVAATVVFLLSDAAGGITATDVLVDGGCLANLYIVETLPKDGASA